MPTHKLTVKDIQLNVSIIGQGSPLLLLNGLGGLIRSFGPLRDELVDYTTITLDVPGVGKTNMPRWPMRLDRIMSEATSYFAIAMAVVVVLVDLWAMISVFRSDKTVGVKAAWAIGLIIFPVLGLIVWGVAGPRGIKEGPSSPEHSKG